MKEITYLPNEYLEEMDCLGDAEFGRLIRGLLYYSTTGEEPELKGTERLFWKTVRNRENRFAEAYTKKCDANAKNGRKGGRPKKAAGFDGNPENQTVFNETQESQPKQNPSRTITELKEDIKAPEEPPAPEPEKAETGPKRHKYGEYKNVLLSDEDLEKLKSELPDTYQDYIERLSAYIASKGAKYKNHLATIRNWARGDKEKTAKKPSGLTGGKFTPGETERASISALARYREQLREG